jgi:hypothetical protein
MTCNECKLNTIQIIVIKKNLTKQLHNNYHNNHALYRESRTRSFIFCTASVILHSTPRLIAGILVLRTIFRTSTVTSPADELLSSFLHSSVSPCLLAPRRVFTSGIPVVHIHMTPSPQYTTLCSPGHMCLPPSTAEVGPAYRYGWVPSKTRGMQISSTTSTPVRGEYNETGRPCRATSIIRPCHDTSICMKYNCLLSAVRVNQNITNGNCLSVPTI